MLQMARHRLKTPSCEHCCHFLLHLPHIARVEPEQAVSAWAAACRNVNLSPDTTPGSDGHKPLMSSTSDGMHSTASRMGPIISNCRIISTGKQTCFHILAWYGC